jgi:hypothetical protein
MIAALLLLWALACEATATTVAPTTISATNVLFANPMICFLFDPISKIPPGIWIALGSEGPHDDGPSGQASIDIRGRSHPKNALTCDQYYPGKEV